MRIINLNNLKHFKSEISKVPRNEILYSIFILSTLLIAASLFLGTVGLLIYWVVK